MGIHTGIEYCDSTLNPMMGCDGCELWNPAQGKRDCYAGVQIERYKGNSPMHPAPFTTPRLYLHRLAQLAYWPDLTGTDRPEKPWLNGYPRIVFLCDMGDPFTKSLPLDWLATPTDPAYGLHGVSPLEFLARLPHIFILITKSPQRMAAFSKRHPFPPNFWLLTSVTSKATVGRIRHLLKVRGGSVRGISAEPLLGPLDLKQWSDEGLECPECRWVGHEGLAPEMLDDPEDDPWFACPLCQAPCAHIPLDEQVGDSAGIQWIIPGGASGREASPAHPDWVRALRDLAEETGTRFFFKQWGEWAPLSTADRMQELPFGNYVPETRSGFLRVGKGKSGRILDGREWSQMPPNPVVKMGIYRAERSLAEGDLAEMGVQA